MKDLIIQIFGVYEPVLDASGAVASGMAGVDWPYVLGVAGFLLVLYSFFRLVGVLLK